jgi:hypothetical protein
MVSSMTISRVSAGSSQLPSEVSLPDLGDRHSLAQPQHSHPME